MAVKTTQQMVDQVARLMETRLRIGGATLDAKLKRGGRRLPRKVRREAEYLAEVSQLSAHPKMQLMLDHTRIAKAYDICQRHLAPIGSRERWIAIGMSTLGALALAVLVVGGGVIAVLAWRGFI